MLFIVVRNLLQFLKLFIVTTFEELSHISYNFNKKIDDKCLSVVRTEP